MENGRLSQLMIVFLVEIIFLFMPFLIPMRFGSCFYKNVGLKYSEAIKAYRKEALKKAFWL